MRSNVIFLQSYEAHFTAEKQACIVADRTNFVSIELTAQSEIGCLSIRLTQVTRKLFQQLGMKLADALEKEC
jgi:hypothetical protein